MISYICVRLIEFLLVSHAVNDKPVTVVILITSAAHDGPLTNEHFLAVRREAADRKSVV